MSDKDDELATDSIIEFGKKFYYTDSQIIGNLFNYYISEKNYSEIKSLCSAIQNINHLKDDYRKIIHFLEKYKQLSDYLYNYHSKIFNFQHYKEEFKTINNISSNENNTIKIFTQNEIAKQSNNENYRLFVKMVGNTKQLSTIIDVRKMDIMWIANTPVWFVPYENLITVINTARINNIDIKIERIDDKIPHTYL